MEIIPAEAVAYEYAIIATTIAKENRLFENVRGLAEYIHNDSFNEKVYSLYRRCENRLKNGTKNCRHSPTLKEEVLQEAIMTDINSVEENSGEFVD